MTLSWKATLALHEAEHTYAHIEEHCEVEEQFVIERLTELIGDAEVCHNLITSPQYIEYRQLVDEKLEGSAVVEQLFNQGTLEEEYFAWCERLTEIDCEIHELDERKMFEGLERQVLRIQSAMSELAFEMPRQAVIEDYFHVESSTTDEDSIFDEDEQ
ncbi:hypothetical protein KC343_g10781 [Hortaea werneckii]|nr:hypothetical protein KC352_g23066 [Hortaea werneckii]KAI7559785.1 hypothetical protein KC317_g10134 [Hortaea werneckii]KAI7606051.1 hypothetical protein KC346_g10731 [Hortaea werneckii]KAI7613688.1 hypothetical protein KC343_g10781 [Hortaea werneckii]KAI7661525.1 hypothetical protein KC319_g8381 [Hortaea werneckii]